MCIRDRALLIGWRFVAARGRAEPEGEGLTPEEKARLDRIMRD